MASIEDYIGPPPAPPSGTNMPPVTDLAEVERQIHEETSIPMTRSALGTINRMLGVPSIQERNEAALNTVINPKLGLTLGQYWDYYATRADRREEFLQREFGAENVARGIGGEPLIRQQNPETGEMQWTPLVAEGKGLGYKITRPLHFWPEFVGGAAAFLATPGGKARLAGTALKSLAGALGAETTGAVADIVSESRIMGDVDYRGIATERGINVPLDLVFDAFSMGAGRLLGKAISPFSNVGPAQINMRKAMDQINSELRARGFKQRWHPTIGERTGNPEVLGIERFASVMPGSRSVFEQVKKEQDEVVHMIQKIALGLDPAVAAPVLPNIETTGREIIRTIRDDVQPFKDAVDEASRMARTATEREAKSLAGIQAGPVMDHVQAGQYLRDTADAMHTAWKQNDPYAAFMKTEPRVNVMDYPVTDLARQLEALKKKVPSLLVATKDKTGRLVDVDTQLKSWSPSGALSRLDELIEAEKASAAAGLPARTSLSKLRQMRTDLDYDIPRGEATPEQGVYYMSQIRDILTKEMNKAVAAWKDPAALRQWALINEEYAKQIKRFSQVNIEDMFHLRSKSGRFIPNETIFQRAVESPDVYNTYRDFFGPNSEAMAQFRKAVANRMLENSHGGMSGDLVNPSKFSKSLDQLWKDNPTLAQEVFGSNSKELARLSDAISQRIGDANVNLYDIKDLLAGASRPTVDAIKDLVEKQTKLEELFSNSLVRDAAAGNVSRAQPHRIVETLLHDKNLSNANVEDIMAVIRRDPILAEKVETAALADIFHRSSFPGKASNTPELRRHELPEIDVKSLSREMGLTAEDVVHAKARVASVIGSDRYRRLEQLSDLLTPRQAAREESVLGGQLAKGAEFGKLTGAGIGEKISYAKNKFHAWVLANIFSQPGISWYVANTALDPAGKALLVNSIIAQGPFIRASIEEWGPEWTQEMIATTKNQTDMMIRFLASEQSKQQKAQGGLINPPIESIIGPWPPTNQPAISQ